MVIMNNSNDLFNYYNILKKNIKFDIIRTKNGFINLNKNNL